MPNAFFVCGQNTLPPDDEFIALSTELIGFG